MKLYRVVGGAAKKIIIIIKIWVLSFIIAKNGAKVSPLFRNSSLHKIVIIIRKIQLQQGFLIRI